MSETTEVERPLLDQVAAQGWTVIDQCQAVPQDAGTAWASTCGQDGNARD